jgi:transcription antitermination factor NusG
MEKSFVGTQGTQWFAVRVKPRHEQAVAGIFEHKGLESCLPLYLARSRWSDRIRELRRPLFPGYVFCRFSPFRRAPILSTPGVFDIVRFGRDPAAVDPQQIASLQQLMHSGVPSQPWPYLEVGQFVEIEDGPLAGCRGVVVEIKKRYRLVLSLTLLQRAVMVELDRDWVKRVSPRSFSSKSPSEGSLLTKEVGQAARG